MSESQPIVDVKPFAIEADHPRNSDLIIQGLERTRLRSAVKPTKMVFSKEEGESVIVPASAKIIDGLPGRIPGMQLHINPAKRKWIVVDPLRDDERLLDRIRKAINKSAGYSVHGTLKGVESKEGQLGWDEMKSLIREVTLIVEAGEAKVIEGRKPDMDDVDELPGKYLLNQTNIGGYRQPRYEEDLEPWAEKLASLGD